MIKEINNKFCWALLSLFKADPRIAAKLYAGYLVGSTLGCVAAFFSVMHLGNWAASESGFMASVVGFSVAVTIICTPFIWLNFTVLSYKSWKTFKEINVT